VASRPPKAPDAASSPGPAELDGSLASSRASISASLPSDLRLYHDFCEQFIVYIKINSRNGPRFLKIFSKAAA
jgi:hypothetical protein